MRLKINKPAACLFLVFMLTSVFFARVNASDNVDSGIMTEDESRRQMNITADAYRFYANQMLSGGKQQFDIALAADTGIEENLLSIYLTGSELKKIAELEASYSYKLNSVILATSGLTYELNRKRPRLDKVSDIYLSPSMLEMSRTELENTKVYRVVTTESCIDIVTRLSDFSSGLLKISGDKLEDITEITDESGERISSMDAYSAYISSFPDNNENISYESLDGRRIVKDTYAPMEYFKNTGIYFYALSGTVLLLIIALVIITRIIIHHKNRKRVFAE